MAKINSTYNVGYYIPEDYDSKALPKDDKTLRRDAQRQAQRDARRRDRDGQRAGPQRGGDGGEGDGVESATAATAAASLLAPEKKRQTWMIAFDMICDRCQAFIPRNTKVYADVVDTGERYLGAKDVKITRLSFKCTRCGIAEIVVKTDPASVALSGYVIYSGARRAGGGGQDWDKVEEAKKQALAEAAADDNNVDAGGTADAAETEMLKAIEKHQRDVMDGELVDAEVQRQLQRQFTSSDAAKQAAAAAHEARAAAATTAAQRESAFSDEERRRIEDEFEQLRREAKRGGKSSSTDGGLHVTLDDLDPSLGLADSDAAVAGAVVASGKLVQRHDSMIDGVLQQQQQAAASPRAAPGSATAPAVVRRKPGGLLASLASGY